MRTKILLFACSISWLISGCGGTDNKQVGNTPADSTVVKDSSADDRSDTIDKPVSQAVTDTATLEQKILDTVFSLPEVKERTDYIEKQTGGKRHLQLYISGTPADLNEDYYEVKAGEDNGDAVVTHFTFYVYPKTFEIKFYDVVDDSAVSLDEWRAVQRKD